MRIPFGEVRDVLKTILINYQFKEERAELCAGIFAGNSRDGVHSHGLNRFPTFISYIQQGLIHVDAEPVVTGSIGTLEQWDGQLAPGMYVATQAMKRAIKMAKGNGLGAVAVRNTNHWMRGGTYGWQAADNGCIAICATNAIANMPPWGGKTPSIANNPMVIALPRKEGHVVLDMAMSQFSYGKMQEYQLKGAQLPVAGGYDHEGNLSTDPATIYSSRRTLPIGFWKGSGLSIMIDLLVSCLSNGRTVSEISADGREFGVSQFFLCISPAHIDEGIIGKIIDFAKSSEPADEHSSVRYPGEQTLKHREESDKKGVLVNEKIWKGILDLKS
jgi:3-dehydro-L-gulonate 2-dehydrogenase